MNNETYEVISWERVHTLRELQDALVHMADDASPMFRNNINLDGINTVSLIENTLSDGSKTMDIRLTYQEPRTLHVHDRACSGPGSTCGEVK